MLGFIRLLVREAKGVVVPAVLRSRASRAPWSYGSNRIGRGGSFRPIARDPIHDLRSSTLTCGASIPLSRTEGGNLSPCSRMTCRV